MPDRRDTRLCASPAAHPSCRNSQGLGGGVLLRPAGVPPAPPAPEEAGHDKPNEALAADLWGRILEEARPLLPPKVFDDWVRPVRPTGLRDGCLRLRVPTPHHRQVLTEGNVAEALRTAAARAGLEDLRLEFVVPDEGPREAPREDAGRNTRRAVRARLKAAGLTPGQIRAVQRRALRSGVGLEALGDLAAGVSPDRADSPYAVVAAGIRDLSAPPPEPDSRPPDFGTSWAVSPVRAWRTAALLVSKRPHVVVRLRTADGGRVELTRTSTVGWSPRTAAVFEYILSVAASLPEEAFAYDGDHDVYEFDVPVRDVRRIIRRRPGQRDFLWLRDALVTAQFTVGIFEKRAEEVRPADVVVSLRRGRGRASKWRVGIRGFVYRCLRERPPELVRSFAVSALPVLAGVDAVTAALARWLAVRFHGRQYESTPLRIGEDELFHLLVGSELRSEGRRREFRHQVRLAVGEIDRLGLLGLLGVPPPNRVAVDVQAGVFVFTRLP